MQLCMAASPLATRAVFSPSGTVRLLATGATPENHAEPMRVGTGRGDTKA